MTEVPELKPCPFCAGKAAMRSEMDYDTDGRWYQVACHECGGGTKPSYARETCPIFFAEIRDRWNDRADLARPAPAEGAVLALSWKETALERLPYMARSPVGNYLIRLTENGVCVDRGESGYVGDTFRTVEAAQSAAQQDYEQRILSALSSPEDATSAAPVSVEEAVKVLLAECERRAPSVQEYDDEVFPSVHDFGAFQETLQELAKNQDRRAALREMQSIREEMEGESGHE